MLQRCSQITIEIELNFPKNKSTNRLQIMQLKSSTTN